MKLSLSAGLLLLVLAVPAWAQPDGPRPRPDGPPRPGEHAPGPPPDRGFPRGKEGKLGRDGHEHRPLGGFLSLPPETRRAIFQSHDADKDGKLNPEEIEKAREEVRQKEIAHRRELVARFDKNNDGRLDEDERRAMRMAWEEHLKESKDDLRKKFDRNGDGTIDAAEKEAAENELRRKWQERRKQVLRRFDKDGDGVLSEEEKEAAMKSLPGPRPDRGPRREPGAGKPGPWSGEPKHPGPPP